MTKRPYQDGEIRRRLYQVKQEAESSAIGAAQATVEDDIMPLLNTRLPIPSPLATIGYSDRATGGLVVGLFSLANVTVLNGWQAAFNAHVDRFNLLIDALKEAGVIEE